MQSHTQTKILFQSSFTPIQSQLLQRKCGCGKSSGLSGECSECQKKKLTLQRQAKNQEDVTEVPPIVHEVLRSPGQPLDSNTRTFMESRFGHDFSQVRVHTDAKAAESAQAVNALAYTVGQDVVLGAGQYTPKTIEGKRLIAHELTHTIQQSSYVKNIPTNLKKSVPNSAAEEEAKKAENAILKGHLFRPIVYETAQIFRQIPAPVPGVSPPSPLPPPVPGVSPPSPLPPPKCPQSDWPPKDWMLPTPSKYAHLPPDLIAKLSYSYKEHDKDKSYFVNGFAGTDPNCPVYWPQNFWKAVDLVGPTLLDVMIEVTKRAMLYPDLWQKIHRIRGAWSTSSKGFKFYTSILYDMKTWLSDSPQFCKDNPLAETIYHQGQSCWREVGRVGKDGLHICLFGGHYPDIHLDTHQVAEGKNEDEEGTCNIDWWAWLEHAKDIW